jgi:peptide/nickel transport system ATP-binding protein
MANKPKTDPPPKNLLEVRDLWVKFKTPQGIFDAVRGVSFSLGRERLGIVGESGSGKSMTSRAILRLIRPPGKIEARRIALEGEDLLTITDRQMQDVRGNRISMIMQDPKFSLNPVMPVGAQITESYQINQKADKKLARIKALEMLEAVSINDPERVFNAYPHELSGGMGQRVMIAMMTIPNPTVLIADEPTSALDVTVQTQVLDIMDKLVQSRGMGLILISHDLNLVSTFCDRILIMYEGRIVETCKAAELHKASHPYTVGLLNSLPQIARPRKRLDVLQRDGAWRLDNSVSGVL